jgi:cation:H+ antiporter
VDIVLLIGSLAIILVAAELFTNGIEWVGHKLNLAEGAVGSVLAAVATAMPDPPLEPPGDRDGSNGLCAAP